MDFYTLLELSQLRAIEAAINPSSDSIFRIKARQYSVTYHTPLSEVMQMDPLTVMQALEEEKYNISTFEEDPEGLLDQLYKIKDPNYSKMSKEDTENLVDAVLNKELKRLSKKKAPTQETIQAEIKASEVKPKSGSMTFGDLEKIDSQTENKGF